MSGPVVSLLPVRNAEADLPGHLASVAAYADLVVALDDGSTDASREVLEADPLVHTVLANPRRDSYAGWDDAANRTRLLEVAIELSASWVVFLDADELIAADDAAALRTFLLHDADPDDAYLFRVFRMIGDLEHHDGSELWVGRAFAPRPGQQLPAGRLHFVPLPTAIPRDRWRKTTVRIQHRGSLTPEARRSRFAKYLSADPDRRWQASYDHLLHAPSRTYPWWPRGPRLPTLANTPVVGPPADGPALSVVLVVPPRHGGRAVDSVRRAVGSVVEQLPDLDEAVELVLVAEGEAAEAVRGAWPALRVVVHEDGAPGGGRQPAPGRIMNQAVAATTGRNVLFVDPSTALAPGCLRAVLESHRDGWPMVGLVPRFAGRSVTGCARYLLAWSAELPGRGTFAFGGAPRRCSFDRELLEEIGGFREDITADADADAAARLFERGYGAHRPGAAVVLVGDGGGGPAAMLRRCLAGGRAAGRSRVEEVRAGATTPRRAARCWARSLPAGLVRTGRDVWRWGADLRPRSFVALPLVVLGAVASWIGQGGELARQLWLPAPGPGRRSRTR